MTDNPSVTRARARGVARFLGRAGLVLLILCAILIGVLKLAENLRDPLEEGFENYLEESTGLQADIGELAEISFFPKMRAVLKNTVLRSPDGKIERARAEEFSVSLPFWAAMSGSGNFESLRLRGVRAEVLSGELTGFAAMDEDAKELELQAVIEGLDFSAISKNFSGGGDGRLAAKGQGTGWRNMVGSLAGRAAFVSVGGRFANADLLALAPEMKTLLPRLDPQGHSVLTCLLADFAIDKGIVRPRVLLADFGDFRVRGTGQVNLTTQTLDLAFIPESADPARVKGAVPLRLQGPLLRPRVGRAEAVSPPEVPAEPSPDSAPFPLRDLGLTEGHPCATYIQAE